MSSLDIARITEKEHRHVMRDIRQVFEDAGIDQTKFGQVYLAGNGQQQPCFILPRRECDLVISGYSVKYRLAIIDRWRELEAEKANGRFVIPQTFAEALRLSADLAEQVSEKTKQLAIAAPKVEFYDAVTASDTICQMAVAAQTAGLPFGRNILFQRLREMGVMISGGDRHNLPKQEYIRRGLFTVKESKMENPKTGEPIVRFTSYVTQRGLDWLIKTFSTPTEQLLIP